MGIICNPGVTYGPKIVTDGLVLHLDAANPKSYNREHNVVRYSEEFDNAIWSKTNCEVVPNDIVAPDGVSTADKIIATVNDDVAIGNTYTAQFNTSSFTYSIFAKAGTYKYIAIQPFVNIWSKSVVFDLAAGVVIPPAIQNDGKTWSIVPYPNGWYRCIVTYPPNYYYHYHFRFGLTNYVGQSDGGITPATSPQVGEYIYVWGAQLETDTKSAGKYVSTTNTPKRSSIWYDLSGNGNHATIYNTPSVTGHYINFDGVDDYAEINPAIKTTIDDAEDFTIISFANIKFIEHVDNLVGWGNANNDGTGYSRTFGQYAFFDTLRTSYSGPNFGSTELLEKPIMYVSRYDDHIYNSKTYGSVSVNTTTDFTGSTTVTWKGISKSWPVTIAKTNYTGRWMKVDLSAIIMYNRLLSDSELDSIYNAFQGRFGI